MKAKKLAKGYGYFDDYNNFGEGIDYGTINFDGDKLKSTREILDGKDCIVSRITNKQSITKISQIEHPLYYEEDQELIDKKADEEIKKAEKQAREQKDK